MGNMRKIQRRVKNTLFLRKNTFFEIIYKTEVVTMATKANLEEITRIAEKPRDLWRQSSKDHGPTWHVERWKSKTKKEKWKGKTVYTDTILW